MKHPLTIAGAIVFAGSWLLLLFGSGADEYRSIINLHKLVIAHAGIVSGLGMMIAGLFAHGMAGLSPRLLHEQKTPPELATSTDALVKQPTMSPEELTKALEEARAKLDRG